ncbi:MAG: hypothetical protein JWQ09_328 [Segetibacter sp.]|nr:hypothetical protein [Segetibacter sp.]
MDRKRGIKNLMNIFSTYDFSQGKRLTIFQ